MNTKLIGTISTNKQLLEFIKSRYYERLCDFEQKHKPKSIESISILIIHYGENEFVEFDATIRYFKEINK